MMRKLLTLVLLIGFITVAKAAVTPNSYVTPQTPKVGATQFVQGTDSPGTYKTIYTGGAAGSKCFSLIMNWDDQGATHVVAFRIVTGAANYDLASYTTTIGLAGNTFSTPVNIFAPQVWPGLPVDVSGNSYIYLQPGDTLSATFQTALTVSNQINIVAQCSDF